MKKSKNEIIDYINGLKGYEGYVQFSHRPIENEKDIFIGHDPHIVEEKGFVYEAHFCNGIESITIRQIDADWWVTHTHIEGLPTQEYDTKGTLPKIKMAQIWQEESDPLCEGMKAPKLLRVVFAGFKQGEAS